MDIKVTKRNGEIEQFDYNKIHKVVEWATEGINGVQASDVEINAELNYREGISTDEIHSVLIKSAEGLISLDSPNYQKVASRLVSYQLRKAVWGGKTAPKLYDFIFQMVGKGLYDKDLLEKYTVAEINKIGECIDHDRDFLFEYCGIRQMMAKYLVSDRISGQIFETPQFMFMCCAMAAFINYEGKQRLNYIKKFYNYSSRHKINLPTPVLAGLRGPMKSYSSCMLVDMGDTMDSIFATVSSIGHATSRRYGIGVNMGRIRPINSPIRGGDVIHTGVVPFLKVVESTVKSCHQNGVRGGSANCNFPWWHFEIEDILQLKNNAGTDDNRVRKLDYTCHFSRLFYERFTKNEDVTLFSPHEAKGLYDAFGHPEFDELYVKYENDPSIKMKKVVSARDLMKLFVGQRAETGRIYVANIDHINYHGPWLDDVKMMNLCLEVGQPTIPLQSLEDSNGEIGICTLSAINMLEINSDAELEKVCDTIVRFLDEVIENQEYFNPAAAKFAKERRSIGVGVSNYYGWLAKHDTDPTQEKARQLTHEFFERLQYSLINASIELAKEKGSCAKFDRTKYSQGILPIDTYKKDVDQIIPNNLKLDWESLRAKIKEHGMRNSTLTSIQPCESSSVCYSSTNGIEPPRKYITHKKCKSITVPVIVPSYNAWKNRYKLAFSFDNKHIIELAAIMQKFVDMAMSTNLYYDYTQYPNKQLPDKEIIKDILTAYKYGHKTLYYMNTKGKTDDLTKEEEPTVNCDSGACAM